MRRLDDLLAAFHSARPGDDPEIWTAHLETVQGNQRVVRVILAAGDLVRMRDGHHVLHAGQHGQLIPVEGTPAPDHADDGPLFAFREMDIVAHRPDASDHVGDLTRAGMD
jgi:CTP:molybdopterin cytidylyltransferase MocA